MIPLVLVTSISAGVYDDEGNVITEEEIEKEMRTMQKKRAMVGCLSGCVSGCAAMIIGFAYTPLLSSDPNADLPLIIGCLSAVYFQIVGYEVGKHLRSNINRQSAIERVKEKRRTQKFCR